MNIEKDSKFQCGCLVNFCLVLFVVLEENFIFDRTDNFTKNKNILKEPYLHSHFLNPNF